MKKAIAILLVLLVAGVAFGADELTVTSNVDGIFKHGFSASQLATFGAVNPATLAASETATVDFSDDSAQVVGYYSFATNTRATFGISLSATALKSDELVTASEYYYVPYTLTFTDKDSDEFSETHNGNPGVTIISPLTINLVTDGYITGLLWDSYQLDLTLDPTAYTEDSIVVVPESGYTSTVTITVTGA